MAMPMPKATVTTTLIAAFFLLLRTSCSGDSSLIEAEEAAMPPSTEGCTDELISFSACLSYISDPPNNLTESPSDKCCEAFSSAVESGGTLCLCYFVRYPNMLGFPLNTTKLLSLSSICTPPPPSLNFLCSASPALPPLNSAAITKPASASDTGSGSVGSGDERRRGGGSWGRMIPKFGEKSPRSGQGSSGTVAFNLPVANGPLPHSTCFYSRNTFLLLLSWVLAILVKLPLLNTL